LGEFYVQTEIYFGRADDDARHCDNARNSNHLWQGLSPAILKAVSAETRAN
jgi:hypothetical protein